MIRTTATWSGPPRGTGYLPAAALRLLDEHGGIISTSELRAAGVSQTTLEVCRSYRSLQAVRQGWHCEPAVPDVIRLAWRFGGPLACVSALEFYEALDSGEPDRVAEIAQPLHICVSAGAARVPTPELLAQRWGVVEPLTPIIHWNTNDRHSGDRRAVSRAVALRQADRCDARTSQGYPCDARTSQG